MHNQSQFKTLYHPKKSSVFHYLPNTKPTTWFRMPAKWSCVR